MSLGDSRYNDGTKKSRWKYEFSVLSLLSNILGALGGGTGVVRTPSLARVSGPGTVAAGASSVSIYNAGLADGTVLGQTIKPGETFTWSANTVDTINAIAFDGTGTELVIVKIV